MFVYLYWNRLGTSLNHITQWIYVYFEGFVCNLDLHVFTTRRCHAEAATGSFL